MDRDRWRLIDALLERALDLPSDQQGAFLDENCPDDELRREVEELLESSEAATDFLSPGGGLRGRLAGKAAEDLDAEDADEVPEEIPGYHWIRRLGDGGMGDVWEAEQLHPVKRRVAIKRIKLGMDTREIVARFESERQALALMNHRSIAKVFEGGATPSGQPYFVMELVEGQPITAYCDEHLLSTEERLELFSRVCDGVQHAHQKGIIHRDLKPSNVLVTTEDGRAIPKIIDFGIARAVEGAHDANGTLLTVLGQLVGTPEYMSPEQADPSSIDVDTRTDIYSLGILLYELLVGVRPFSRTEILRSIDEIRRQVLETDPLRPSTRWKNLGAEAPTIAAKRRIDTSGLQRRLRGDLDWIVMKALDRDRDRRYPSPSELAADVRRHLDDQPVSAGPPSATYRLRKLLRRHRVAMTAAALVVCALVLGAIVSSWWAIRAVRAERLALQEAEAARQLSDFLVGIFEVSDPDTAQGETITARELLEEGATRIRFELEDEPLIRARIQETIGRIQLELGLYEEAEPLLRESLTTREELLAPDSPAVRASMRGLAQLAAGRGDPETARELFEATLELQGSETSEESARLLSAIADLDYAVGDYEAALAGHRRSIEILDALPDEASGTTTVAWIGVAACLHRLGKPTEAEGAYRKALEIQEASHGPDHPDHISLLSGLATVLGTLGRDAEGEALHRRAVTIAEKVYGPKHSLVAMSLNNLAGFLGRTGQVEDAQETFERALAIRTELYGEDHPLTARVHKNLGQLALNRGKFEISGRHLRHALAVDLKHFGEDSYNVAWLHNALGDLERRTGRWDEADEHYRLALEAYGKTIGTETGDASRALGGQSQVALARGDFEKAEQLFRQTLDLQKRLLPEGHPWFAVSLDGIGEALLGQGKAEQAFETHQRALEIRIERHGTEHPQTAKTMRRLGCVHLHRGELEQAETILRQALSILESGPDPDHPDVATTFLDLGDVLRARGDELAARESFERALQLRRARLPKDHPGLAEAIQRLGAISLPHHL